MIFHTEDLDRALQLDPTDAFALRRRGEVKRMTKDFVAQRRFCVEWLLNFPFEKEPLRNRTFS